MDFEAFLRGIRFRLFPPDCDVPYPIRWLSYACRDRLGLPLEHLCVVPPEREPLARLWPLRRISRMSTATIGAIVNKAVSQMAPQQCYVNVGVWKGYTFLAGCVGNPTRRCVGIDNFSEFGGPKDAFLAEFERHRGPAHEFHEMDYRAYFETVHQGQIGVYFYDGEHSYENQLAGLQVAEDRFADDCIVVVDDTNLEAPRAGTLDFIAQSQHRYEVLWDVRTACHGHPSVWNGLMVLRRR